MLKYISVVSRHEMNFVVSSLSQVFKNRSPEQHWLVANKIRFCDSDWEGDPNDGHYTGGHCFKKSDGSNVFCWLSREQQTVALPLTDAEFMSFSSASQEFV